MLYKLLPYSSFQQLEQWKELALYWMLGLERHSLAYSFHLSPFFFPVLFYLRPYVYHHCEPIQGYRNIKHTVTHF